MRFRSDSFRAFGPSQFTRRSLNIASARSRSAGRTQKKRQYFVVQRFYRRVTGAKSAKVYGLVYIYKNVVLIANWNMRTRRRWNCGPRMYTEIVKIRDETRCRGAGKRRFNFAYVGRVSVGIYLDDWSRWFLVFFLIIFVSFIKIAISPFQTVSVDSPKWIIILSTCHWRTNIQFKFSLN